MRGNSVDKVGVRQLITRLNACSLGEPMNISIVDASTNNIVLTASTITDELLIHPAMKLYVSGIKPCGYNAIQIFAHK